MSVGETLLGGLLAALAGAGTLWLERRSAHKDSLMQQAEKQSALTFSAVLRIQQMHAWFSVISRNVDECFDAVHDPKGEIDPGLKVLPIIMPAVQPAPFSPEELALAYSTKDNGLVERLLNLDANFQSSVQLLREFNDLRREHMSFVQSAGATSEGWSGDQARVTLPEHTKHGHESRVVILNQLVAFLIEGNGSGLQECRLVMARLCTALRSLPNVSIPQVVFPEEKKDAHP